MAIEDFFNQTCNIYHLKKADKNLGYGISDTSYYYNNTPDLESIPCRFYLKTVEQVLHNTPQPLITGRMKIALSTDIDIRSNDKILNNTTGLTYIVEIVHNIRGHHLMAYMFREDEDQMTNGRLGGSINE